MVWLIYLLAALAEIAGCFAFWAWLKLGRSPPAASVRSRRVAWPVGAYVGEAPLLRHGSGLSKDWRPRCVCDVGPDRVGGQVHAHLDPT